MQKASLTALELTGLAPREIGFVVEYVKDYDARRAAERSGYNPSQGAALLGRDDIMHAVSAIVSKRLAAADIDASWVLMELVDNHVLARQAGKLAASNTALGTIAKLAAIDAFAADKVMTVTDQAVLDRLQRARQRAAGEPVTPSIDAPVSFI